VKAVTGDDQLMLAFQRGEREAFAELFQRYREPVYGFFRRRVPDSARAEDLTQETFLAVVRGASRYEARDAFRSYLYGIAYNLLFAEQRKAARPDSASGLQPSALDEVLWVRQALERLEPEQREVLMLREYEELSYDEIAGVLKIPVNTVRSRLFRARMALKDVLVGERT
jgi:RNA polymerase sigma-70 factor (ECF subfamily)